jgi:hypothetical protein
MSSRRRFKQALTLPERLTDETVRLRSQLEDMKPGSERDEVLRRIRQNETGMHMSEWLTSPSLRAPS